MTEKKRFRKAMSQLDSAFQKANEVNIPTKINKFVKKTEQEKRVALDNIPTERKQHQELLLERPHFKAEPMETVKQETVKQESIKTEPIKQESIKTEPIKQESIKTEPIKQEPIKQETVKTESIKTEPIKQEPIKQEPMEMVKPETQQPNLEIKKTLRVRDSQKKNTADTKKDATRIQTVPFDSSFGTAVEKLAKKKTGDTKQPNKVIAPIEPNKDVEVVPRDKIDFKDPKIWQQTLENSLCLALNKILKNQATSDNPLPESFYKTSGKVRKNRDFLKSKFSQFSDVKVDFYVQLGDMNITLSDLLSFKEGMILETEISPSNKLNCYANRQLLGQGKLVFKGYTTGFELQKFFE